MLEDNPEFLAWRNKIIGLEANGAEDDTAEAARSPMSQFFTDNGDAAEFARPAAYG